ncbi:protein kinase domain-containing protein [Streptomyces sp. DSM 40750]|uniref:protein kinase domain-containing protein n=1 Tax=Streptomyces sp. DSM 40750 TaxID=2801030 RepID=UPI0027D47CFD|nr:protein kinase [Streptomyces sp. DSM 40750]
MQLPHNIGRYRLEKRLGSGAFGVVWMAHDDSLQAPVAIKVMADNWAHRLDLRERFLSEARLLRQAASPRVVQVHDIGELPDERPYFVMEYADGGTLEDRLADGPLPPDEALRLATEAARAVAVLHEAGILHRDIKPSNMLLRSELGAERPRLLVADLGLAKSLAHASGLTMTAGSAGYMAPEQAEPGEGIDARADVYGLGALAYHLLTGTVPASPGKVVPPGTLRPGLPARTEQSIMRALETNRDLRWPTATAFANELADLATQLPDTPDAQSTGAPGAPDASAPAAPGAPDAQATGSSVAEPTAGPVAEPTAGPVAEPTAGPVAEPTAGPVAEPTAGPVAEPTAGPVAEPTAGPVAEPTAGPVAEPTAGPVAEPTAGPVAEPTAGSGAGETATPAPEPIAASAEAQVADAPAQGNGVRGARRPRRLLLTAAAVASLAGLLAGAGWFVLDGRGTATTATPRASKNSPSPSASRSPAPANPVSASPSSTSASDRSSKSPTPTSTDSTGNAGGAEVTKAAGNALSPSTSPSKSATPDWTTTCVQPNSQISAGQSWRTNRTRMVMRTNGDLVIYDEDDRARWSSGTTGSGNRAYLQGDGNLVVFGASGESLWHSATQGHDGAVLCLGADGNVNIIYQDRAIWSAGTGH